MKRKSEKMKKSKKILAVLLFCLPCIFFVLAYLTMSMSGEDVAQANMSSGKDFPSLIAWVYHYIPRIGEFVTWPVATGLTYQTSFGFDLFVRMVDMVAVLSIVYLLTCLALRRKLKIALLDAGIFNTVFLLLTVMPQLISPYFGNPFLSGFSFIHNYVLMSLIAILFTIPFIAPFLGIEKQFGVLRNSFSIFVLGFLFAISTELLPVCFIGVLILYCLYIRLVLHKKIQIEKWQRFAVVGIIAGLAFFYLGGGLSARTGFTYAETYDYISLSSIFTAPRHFIVTFLLHFVNNIKYLIPIASFSLLAITTYRVKKGKMALDKARLHVLLLVFSFIYIIGASLIMLDDALTVRFLLPCYLAFVFTVGLFIADFYDTFVDNMNWRFAIGLFIALFSLVVISDMMIGKVQYAKRTNEQLTLVRDRIDRNPDKLCLTKQWASSEAGPVYSPIFSFTQEPIFEPWNVKKIYGHEIQWAELGEENLCE